MNVGRGYQANTLLSNGEVLTVGGSWSGRRVEKPSEIWSPATQTWRALPGLSSLPLLTADAQGLFRSDNHMTLFPQRDGWVLHAGPSFRMSWLNTAGNGTIVPAGTRGVEDAMCGNGVQLNNTHMLFIGGSKNYERILANDLTFMISTAAGPGNPVVTIPMPSMTFIRTYHNSVLLPNGDVVVLGGQSFGIPFTDGGAIMIPELWSAKTGTYSRLRPISVPRTYHSTALLMRDGRVFLTGGGLCGCAADHLDAQILTPPYLMTGAARPSITSAPANAFAGQTFVIQTSASVPVSYFAMVRLSVTTHTVNNDMRRIVLTATPVASAPGQFTARVPVSTSNMLGDYFLYALTAADVPSQGRLFKLTG
jgi:galactose oxidase